MRTETMKEKRVGLQINDVVGETFPFRGLQKVNDCVLLISDDRPFASSIGRALSCTPLREVLESLSVDGVVCVNTMPELEAFRRQIEKGEYRIRLAMIVAEFGVGERHRRRGIAHAESLRRDWKVRAPILFLSLDRRERLAAKCPVVQEEVAGTFLLQVPFRLADLKERLQEAAKTGEISERELKQVVRDCCHLEEALSALIHDASNHLRAGCWDEGRACFERLKAEVEFYELDPLYEATQGIGKLLSEKMGALSDADVQAVQRRLDETFRVLRTCTRRAHKGTCATGSIESRA